MAMAMASAVAGVKIVSTTPVHCLSVVAASSSSSSSILCSSFTGLSLQTWQKSKHGMPLSLSVSSAKPSVPPPRKLLFTVAKLKTHKAAAKRFRVTGSGKIMRRHAYRQHLLSKKSTKRKNRLSKSCQVNRRDYDNVIGALPYLKVKGRVA